jgi:PAS domain S-box-containing protein
MSGISGKVEKRAGSFVAFKIAGIYVAVAALWIFFSDELLGALVTDPAAITRLAILKGWIFVAVTAVMLYVLIERYATAFRRHNEALETQFTQLTTIFDSLNTLVYVADRETHRLLYMNRYGESLFGADWKDKICYEQLQAGVAPCEECASLRLNQDSTSLTPHISERRNDKTGSWYQCMERVIKWTDERPVLLVIAVDITERKEVEQIKDEMISAVSHEMRTPLTAMLGFTEFLLTNRVQEEELRSSLETIYQETSRLNELIGNFLDLQRIKAQQMVYRFTSVPIEPLLHEAATVLAVNYGAHRIIVDSPVGLPPVRGDEARLRQVLENLISNAAKYSAAGSRVTLGATQDGAFLTIRVSDEGVGVPPEMQSRIFDRFFRVDNTDRRMVGGAGLGLALVKEIVAAHGGRVWVESAVGKGSTFYVTLPVMEESAAAE